MSGHSKWATTKRKKANVDAKRGQLFTKLAKIITVASRDGGGDKTSNASLRMAIDNAKAQSMPKENIERAIDRGAGGGIGANIESITYEAYGPSGVAFLIECLTDNKNRALSEVKMIINKYGGSMASAGSVGYLFCKKGELIIERAKNQQNIENIEEAIINSVADDYEIENDIIVVYTKPNELHAVKTAITESGITIESAELINLPNIQIDIEKNNGEKVEALIEALDDLDDVNRVYSNI